MEQQRLLSGALAGVAGGGRLNTFAGNHMKLLRELWRDESGLVMSAETVTLGTVGVLGAVVGMNAAGTAVNDELKEFASAIRSLDQSYAYQGHRGCGAWTAGSCYIQQDVQQSLAEINGDGQVDVRTIQQRIEEDRKALSKPATALPSTIAPVETPLPNQLPTPESKTGSGPETVPAKK